jgi:hypothetical protein
MFGAQTWIIPIERLMGVWIENIEESCTWSQDIEIHDFQSHPKLDSIDNIGISLWAVKIHPNLWIILSLKTLDAHPSSDHISHSQKRTHIPENSIKARKTSVIYNLAKCFQWQYSVFILLCGVQSLWDKKFMHFLLRKGISRMTLSQPLCNKEALHTIFP